MNSIFATIYSIILFIILLILSLYIIRQIINTQKGERAIISLQNDTKKDSVSYSELYKLGQLYLQRKLFNKAILIFRQALKLWDINDKIGIGSLSNTIGFTYFKLKKYKFAIYYYKVALNILPDYTLAWKNLAYVYELINLKKEAYICYQKILLFDPQNSYIDSKIKLLKRSLSFSSSNDELTL